MKHNYSYLRKIVPGLILIVIVAMPIFDQRVRGFFWRILTPIAKPITLRLERGHGLLAAIINAPDLAAENNRLQSENERLRNTTATIEMLIRENTLLRSQLQVAARSNFELALVSIVDLKIDNASAVIVINRGSRDGLAVGMPVISGGNVLVGVIDKIFSSNAYVRLLADPRTRIGVRVGDKVLAYARGDSNQNMHLELVTINDPVVIDDFVVTSGTDGLPEALSVGTVMNVELSRDGLFKDIKVKPLFDVGRGTSLFVIIK